MRGKSEVIQIEAIKEERVDTSGVDWNFFTQENEVELPNGVEKRLALTNWSQTEHYGSPAIRFDVIVEDEKEVNKYLTTKSRRLIKKLKPLIDRAFAQGKHEIHVSLMRFGSGYDTDYLVRELK